MDLIFEIKEKKDEQTTFVLGSFALRLEPEFYDKLDTLPFLGDAILVETETILKKRIKEIKESGKEKK